MEKQGKVEPLVGKFHTIVQQHHWIMSAIDMPTRRKEKKTDVFLGYFLLFRYRWRASSLSVPVNIVLKRGMGVAFSRLERKPSKRGSPHFIRLCDRPLQSCSPGFN